MSDQNPLGDIISAPKQRKYRFARLRFMIARGVQFSLLGDTLVLVFSSRIF
jgi:hypothetical protein